MRILAFVSLLLVVSGCTAKSSTSEMKLRRGDDAILTENGVIKGVCLQRVVGAGNGEEYCSASTLQGCRELRSATIRTTFVQTPSCACYDLEQKQLAEFDRLQPFTPSSESEFALAYDDIPEATESPIEIGKDMNEFYKKHPECVVSTAESEVLLP